MVRPPCCEKINVKRAVWTAEEDAKILAFVSRHGSGNWTSVPEKAGLKRCGKSCRLRWTNYLRPDLKHDSFTNEEEDLIIKLHAAIGSRWSIIAQQLPGRTDNDVKNYWNTKLKKKLSQMGIDPVTHKPFSKLIADYGTIGANCQKPSTRIGSVTTKDFNNAILLKPELHQTLPQGFRNINNQPKQMESTENKNSFSSIRSQTDNLYLGARPSNCIDMENETVKGSIFGERCLSSNSSSATSSSTCSTAAKRSLPLVPFSWNDFLLDDAFAAPSADNQEHENENETFFSKELVSQMANVTRQSWNKKEVRSQQALAPGNDELQIQSSSEVSFVEAMLDQENEMFLSFPHLMEEPSNY